MSSNITTAEVEQYRSNVEMLVQQRGSLLRKGVRVESVTGKSAYFEQVGLAEALLRTAIHADSPLLETPHQVTRVDMADYEWGDLVDDFSRVKILISPTGAYTTAAGWAMGRAMDDVIITAATGNANRASGGTAATSATASTLASFNNSSQLIAVNFVETGSVTNSGLTVGKLREARKILREGEVADDEELFIAVRAQQINDLLRDDEVTSFDFNTVKALATGELNSYMGFNFIVTQRLDNGTIATDVTTCFAWAKSGLVLATAMDVKANIAPRPDKSFSTYVHYGMSIGSARLEDQKMVQIACDESP